MSNKFSKRRRTRAIKRKNNKKTRRNRKGGFLFDQKLNIGGIDLGRESGKKQYNWKTGKWDDMICYKIGPIPFCKIVPAE
jgi:hypothetical protein